MNKTTLVFEVKILVDDDHEGVPEPDEVKLQIERAILDDMPAGATEVAYAEKRYEDYDVYKTFGILDCDVVFKGEVGERCSKMETFHSDPGYVLMKRCTKPTGHGGQHSFTGDVGEKVKL